MCGEVELTEELLELDGFGGVVLKVFGDCLYQVSFPDVAAACLFLSHGVGVVLFCLSCDKCTNNLRYLVFYFS